METNELTAERIAELRSIADLIGSYDGEMTADGDKAVSEALGAFRSLLDEIERLRAANEQAQLDEDSMEQEIERLRAENERLQEALHRMTECAEARK